MLQKLTNLKADGGVFKGGAHKDTYDHKLKTKMKKKWQNKEDAAQAEEIKKTKTKFATICKMIATKLKNKKEKHKAEGEAKEGAVAVASSTD